MGKEITFFDCFAGCGGFRMGMQRAGFKPVGFCEIDKHASKLYKAYYDCEGEYYAEDATKIITGELPDFDILTGGFPCQAFSVAGKRQGFEDSRGTLFFELARILRDKRPRCFVFENVKGLLTHESGETFKTILGVLADIGYTVEWQVLNSKYFGVPQNRERVFIVGYLGGPGPGKIFPIRTAAEVCIECNENKEKIHNIASTMTARQYASWNGNFVKVAVGYRYDTGINYFSDKTRSCLRADNQQTVLVQAVRNINKPNPRGNGRLVKNNNEEMFTLTTMDQHGIYDGCKIRQLTPLECFRLQGFPDDIVKKAYEIGISDTQLYKIAGNSVTVNVIQEIAMGIREYLEKEKAE